MENRLFWDKNLELIATFLQNNSMCDLSQKKTNITILLIKVQI